MARAAEEQSRLPLVHENISDLAGVIPQLVYQKGGSVLQMLRGQVGTEGFWTAIRAYYRRHQNGNASSDDLRRAFEQTSADRAPKDVVLDPNTWMMMDPPKFVAR